MVVLVPIRTQSAFANVDDVDAKNMGLMEDERQRLQCDEQQRVQTLKTRAEDRAEFRSEREAFQKNARRVASAPSALQQGNRVEKRTLPGFLKVRSGAEGISAGADDLEQPRAQASSSSECVTQGERKRPRPDLQESQGDGRRPSSTTTAMTVTVASAATSCSVGLAGHSQEAQTLEATDDAAAATAGSAADPNKLLTEDNADNARGAATAGSGIGLMGYSSDESSPTGEEVENACDNEEEEEEDREDR